ncbi:copper amine oxidase N-terminal domain-containing protein [Paenibacillus sp. KN14-4R]|uniref:copper amine oxidase N-terminal domain-containing protein n=1 Tax=Paenibacillus sp. KN14-4R TaxID=3445773 RepID=UPI003F9FB8AF
MKKKLVLSSIALLLAAMTSQIALADIPIIPPHPNDAVIKDNGGSLDKRDKKESVNASSSPILNGITVTSTRSIATITGKFTKSDIPIYMTVKRASDDAIKYFNDGKTNANGEYRFQVQLKEGDYTVELQNKQGDEVYRSSFKVTSGTVPTPTPSPDSGTNPPVTPGGGGGGGGGGATTTAPANPTTLKLDANGKLKLSKEQLQTMLEKKQPLILQTTDTVLTFPYDAFDTEQLNQALASSGTSLELSVHLLKQDERKELLLQAGVGESKGIIDLGGVTLEIQAAIIQKDGSKTPITNLYEPLAVTIDVSDILLSSKDIASLTGVSYVLNSQGNYTIVKLGGTYDALKKTITFYIDRLGNKIGIVKANKLTTIGLKLDDTNTKLNGVNKLNDVAPTLVNDRVMVPARYIAESFGAQVSWNEEKGEVGIELDGKLLTMTVGQKIEGFDAPPVVVNDRVLVPIRYISEQFGAYVLWFPSTSSVEIVK